MNEKELQKTAYLYGQSSEMLMHYHDDTEVYRRYAAASMRLWHTLKENDALYEDGRLKLRYVHAMESGQRSVNAIKTSPDKGAH